MKCRAAVIVIALGFLSFGTASGANLSDLKSTSIRTLTLEESIQIAVRSALIIAKSKKQVDLAGSNLVQAYAQFHPNFSFGSTVGRVSGKSMSISNAIYLLDSASEIVTLQISSSLNLLSGMADSAALEAALARKKASELSLSWAKQQIALDVTQTFLRVILDGKMEEIARSNLRVSEDRLRLFKAQKKVGSASSADLFRQESVTSADRITLIQASARKKADLILLIRKLRLDANLDYELKSPDLTPRDRPELSGSESELIRLALSRRVDLQANRASIDGLSADIKFARAGSAPHLDLDGSFGSFGRVLDRQLYSQVDAPPIDYLGAQRGLGSQLLDQKNYAITLNFSWNLFDRGLTRSNVAKAVFVQENAKLDDVDSRNQVVGDVKESLNNFRAAAQQLSASEAGLIAAQKADEVIRARFRVGASSFIDLALAQAALIQAQAVQAQTLVNYRLQGDVLSYYIGAIKTDY